MNRYRCQYCGSNFHNEAAWTRHSEAECFSRITTCTLCGLTMAALHKEEHLRVIHGIAGGGDAAVAAARQAQQAMERAANSNSNSNNQTGHLGGSFYPQRSSVMTAALGIAPISNPAMRAVNKSPALSRVAERTGVLRSVRHDDGRLLDAVLLNKPGEHNNNNSAAVGGGSGFSFRSNDALLARAGTPQRLRELDASVKQHQERERAERLSAMRDEIGNGGKSRNGNSNSQSNRRSPSHNSQQSNNATGELDSRAQARLKLVEQVVHNIVSHSPVRRQENGDYGGGQRKPSHLLSSQAGRRHSPSRPATSRSPSLSLLGTAAMFASAPRPSSLVAAAGATAATANSDMLTCPECGKAIFSVQSHQCPAQSTQCPKCGDTVALLSFDRHFLECAVPSWAATRERKETERMVERNAASFRASRSATTFRRQQQQSQGNFIMGEQSFQLSSDVALLDSDGEEESETGKKPPRSSVSSSSHSSMLEVERRERKRQKLEKQQQQQQAEQDENAAEQQAAPCPPGHRPCPLCSKPIRDEDVASHLDLCTANVLSCPLCLEGVAVHEMEAHQVTCPANRRRCFNCNTSIQFARLAEHVAQCCDTGTKLTMYHGTTGRAAREIVKNGFLPSANGLLGEGVYMSRDMGKAKNYGPVIIEAIVTIPDRSHQRGGVITIPAIGHRLQKSWQRAGYEAAWMPQGVSKSGLEEHCIRDPRRIAVVRIVEES